MGQITASEITETTGNVGLDICAPAELSRNEALSLLRLLSPQTPERNLSGTGLLTTPNGGQLYVRPYLYG